MPSPEVIDLTLSDDEIQPDPIRSDQGTSMPTRATNRFRTSSSTPPTSGINRIRGEFFLTEFRQPIQVQTHLEMSGILVQLGHIQRT